jgi:hypothetical protein
LAKEIVVAVEPDEKSKQIEPAAHRAEVGAATGDSAGSKENLPRKGKLRLAVNPAAGIYIDGRLYQQNFSGEYECDLPIGEHLVKVESSLGVWEKSIAISADSLHVLRVDFEKMVRLTVAVTSGWAEIFVDGKTTGRYTPSEILLRAGKHVIEVRREGYEIAGGPIEINLEEDRAQPLIFKLVKSE